MKKDQDGPLEPAKFAETLLDARRSVSVDPPRDLLRALMDACRAALEYHVGLGHRDVPLAGEVRLLCSRHVGRNVLTGGVNWDPISQCFACHYLDMTRDEDSRYYGLGGGTWEFDGPAWVPDRVARAFEAAVAAHGIIPFSLQS